MVDYAATLSEIRDLYVADRTPWVIGFSGGKDSTTVLQMVFYALSALPRKRRTKQIHVLSNDTLVENPAIVAYLKRELKRIEAAGKEQLFKHNPKLFQVVRVTPQLDDRFWVNLIGKGYPSPNRWFRWCTERIKIKPTSTYILDTISKKGRAIIILGSRRAESANRAASMKNYNDGGRLRRHSLPNAFVYTPIAEYSNNEVWAYLLQAPSPWGGNNRRLLSLYGSACSGGECPFAIETGTESCGKSRFGCWVCTVVDRDRSMENMIDNGDEWMHELLKFRNWLYDIRQQTNQYVPKHLHSDVHFGPFLLRTRRQILRRLLKLQERSPIQLIGADELRHVRSLLQRDRQAQVEQGLKRFVLELRNGKRMATVSDFNLLLTARTRLGAWPLKGATLVGNRTVSQAYSDSTRVLYYGVLK